MKLQRNSAPAEAFSPTEIGGSPPPPLWRRHRQSVAPGPSPSNRLGDSVVRRIGVLSGPTIRWWRLGPAAFQRLRRVQLSPEAGMWLAAALGLLLWGLLIAGLYLWLS